MIHNESSPLAGTIVRVNMSPVGPENIEIEVQDYWDRLPGNEGNSWMKPPGTRAVANYAFRVGAKSLPFDDEVLYGKAENHLGYLFHVSEIVKN